MSYLVQVTKSGMGFVSARSKSISLLLPPSYNPAIGDVSMWKTNSWQQAKSNWKKSAEMKTCQNETLKKYIYFIGQLIIIFMIICTSSYHRYCYYNIKTLFQIYGIICQNYYRKICVNKTYYVYIYNFI